jgi:tetratricopeptide (TPR) repeat protein
VPAVAYRGWLLRLAGSSAGNRDLIDQGVQWLDQAIALDPKYPDSHFFKGLILLRDRNDPAGAVAELRAALADDPPEDMAAAIQGTLSQAEAAAAGTLPPGVTPAPTTTTTPP